MKPCDVCNKCFVNENDVCVECWWQNSGISIDNEYCETNKMTFAQAKDNYKLLGIISSSLIKTRSDFFQKNIEAFSDLISQLNQSQLKR